jgi:PIN domain nuclease of toxin-antitoxin system
MLDPAHTIMVSDASIWEIAIKAQAGKLKVLMQDVDTEIASNGYEMLAITRAHITAVATLPRHHGDPFDHLLIAQAIIEDIPILTADDKFAAYPARLTLS